MVGISVRYNNKFFSTGHCPKKDRNNIKPYLLAKEGSLFHQVVVSQWLVVVDKAS